MGKRLLLADSSLAVQKLVEFSLGKEGYEVTSVNDGLSALDLADRVEPDVILSDLNLKGVNVYSFCEKVRRKNKLKQTPILVLVNYTDTYDEEKLRGAGVVDFIRKPLESGELIEKVKTVGTEPTPVSEQTSIENLARQAPLDEENAPNEDSVKIEELLGWSVSEKSPFTEITDKAEPGPGASTSESDDIFIVEEEAEASRPAGVDSRTGRTSESPSPTAGPSDTIEFKEQRTPASGEPPMELASAAEMIPPVTAQAFGVPPVEIDDGPEPPIELVSAAEMTPSAESFSSEEPTAAEGASLSPEQMKQVKAITEKIVEEIVARLAKEVIEKVTWEVVPSLADVAIRKEIEKLKVPD